MKSKGAVKLFAIALAIVCIFQLSFTWVTYRIENKAKEFANGDAEKERQYIDSISREPVYNLGFAKYTYLQCKERELNLGLDLQGGMNVTMEVSLGDFIRSLSNNSPDPGLNKAISLTNEKIKNSSKDYVTLFSESYNEVEPNGKLAAIFANQSNKDKIKISSSNSDVINYIRGEANEAIDRSFQILRARIDKFGVTQPNIQKLEGSGRILVELPGVDNPGRVRKLLQGTAKLEFWETYDNIDAFKHLTSANEALKKVLALEKNGGTDSSASGNATDTAANAKSALAGLGKTQETKDSASANKKDTTQKTLEDFTRENPLFAVLRPYADESNRLVPTGSSCGIAAVKDTAKVNAYLNRPEVRAVMPNNIRFSWAYKGFGNNNEAVILHALRASKNGGAAMEGDKITDARRDVNQSGQTEVSMTMNAEGAHLWKNLTKQNVDHSIAIVLDDVVYSSPNVQNEIPNGRSSITGGFTNEEAADLANILKAGKLPAPTHIVEEAIVGPTLGKEAIQSGLLSFVIALLLVLVFMVFYYSNAGWVADIALFANMFFIIGVLTSLGAVLTLPGIAGIVLTIGLSVDANILIFERVREEMGHERGTNIAIREGFKHAMSSIIDSNVTTLLLGIILYSYGNGPIQGFATTLIIGILTSLFSAIFITRLIFEGWMEKNKVIRFSTKMTEGAFKKINIDFVSRRKIYYMISGVIIAAGIVSFISKGFSYGVDFSGGRTYTVRFENTLTTTDIRSTLAAAFDGQEPEVKTFGSSNQQRITTSYLIRETGTDVSEKVETRLKQGLDKLNTKYEIVSAQIVGPTIAEDIKSSAFIAIILSLIVMYIFIQIRFKSWQYGLGATAALFHDVLVVLSFFTLFNGVLPFSLDINQDFIAAILTVMGYSMTDTVVVFDRIREYLTQKNKANLDKGEKNTVINYALNSTLSRTINTSLTIFFVLLAIFVFGGEVIRGFSFALLIGIVIGTYSSICIATPIVIDFDRKK